MARKPYLKAQSADWYMQSSFYKRYMLRELTAVPVALLALNLCWGIVSLAGSLPAWQRWLELQTHPLMLLLTLLGILAALYNSKTWFEAMPKAVRIQTGEKFVDDKLLIGGNWATLVVILLFLAGLVVFAG